MEGIEAKINEWFTYHAPVDEPPAEETEPRRLRVVGGQKEIASTQAEA